MTTRSEHLEWCKQRALAECNQGRLQQALGSMISDLRKHPETEDHPAISLSAGLMAFGDLNTTSKVREFITSFN